MHEFAKANIPNALFSHSSHLRVAYLFLLEHEFNEAFILIEIGIKRLNRANKILDSPVRGFNATITRAWALRIKSRLNDSELIVSSHDFLSINSDLLEPNFLNNYYSPKLLMSAKAKRLFVAPDIKKLPH